jgi:hypothetical protein
METQKLLQETAAASGAVTKDHTADIEQSGESQKLLQEPAAAYGTITRAASGLTDFRTQEAESELAAALGCEDVLKMEKEAEHELEALKEFILTGHHPEPSALPVFADFAHACDKWYLENMGHEEYHTWEPNWSKHINNDCPIFFRHMTTVYMEMLKESAKHSSIFGLSEHKSNLLSAVQATEAMYSTVTAHPSIWSTFDSMTMLLHPAHLPGQEPELTDLDKYSVQLLKVLSLFMLFVHPPERELWERETETSGFFDTELKEKHRAIADNSLKRLAQKKEDEEREKTVFGIDKRYFVSGMHGDLDFVIMMKNYMKHFKGHTNFQNEEPERKFCLIEERVLGVFKMLLGKVLSELRQQLEHATQQQAKILSGISTAAFTVITFIMNYYQRVALEGGGAPSTAGAADMLGSTATTTAAFWGFLARK